MKKLLILCLIISITPFIASFYGIIHDQLTYTISPEYYTKFKFYQFGLAHDGSEAIFPNPRFQVSIVGILATWWVGVPIGLIVGLIGLIHDKKRMLKNCLKTILLVLCITLITGLVGLAYGKFILAKSGVNWFLPENLIDSENFIAVGSMHNFSYLGGLIGLIVGIIYSASLKRKQKAQDLLKN